MRSKHNTVRQWRLATSHRRGGFHLCFFQKSVVSTEEGEVSNELRINGERGCRVRFSSMQ